MSSYNSEFTTFISPEETPIEVYPYRRVWRAMAIEISVMLGLVVLVIVGVFVGLLRNVPSQNWGLVLILVPLGIYLYVSVRGEQQVERPREGLLTVTLFSALLANGVGVPLVEDVFAPREWLADATFFTRWFGYAFTYGVTTEFLKYIAIRYTIWPSRIRVRMDGVAYSIAASVGYAVVLNLGVVFGRDPVVVADAFRIATNFITQIGFGVIMGFFLAEMALNNRPPIFLPMGLLFGALMQGFYIAFRAIASGSDFAAEGDISLLNLNGFLLAPLFVLLVALAINFLINNADKREADLAGVKRIR